MNPRVKWANVDPTVLWADVSSYKAKGRTHLIDHGVRRRFVPDSVGPENEERGYGQLLVAAKHLARDVYSKKLMGESEDRIPSQAQKKKKSRGEDEEQRVIISSDDHRVVS